MIFRIFVLDSVFHSWSVPMIKITDLYVLCKWDNLQNRQCIKYLFSPLYIVAGRVSATSTTARWSRIVDSADHPEFRSYFFGKLRRVRVPYRTVKRQYFYHVVQGYLPIFKIPRDPRGDLPSLHTLDGTRTERAASVLEPCVTWADGHRDPSVQRSP